MIPPISGWQAGLYWTLQIIVALGGLGGVGALFYVRQQKRKMVSESNKTDAEAETALADAFSRRTATSITLLEPYEKIMRRQQEEIDEQAAEIKQLRRYIVVLTARLREQGVELPDMPPVTPPHGIPRRFPVE